MTILIWVLNSHDKAHSGVFFQTSETIEMLPIYTKESIRNG